MKTRGPEEYDVIVAGGGPAGAGAAIGLAAGGARVLLAEQRRFPRAKLCGEFISPECLAHFARLGVLEEMCGAGGARLGVTEFYAASGRHTAVPSAWFGESFGGGAALGLSRAEMDRRLLERARAVGVEVLEEAQASALLLDEGRVAGVRLRSRAGEGECRALVTIDATGRTRALARRAEGHGASGLHAAKTRTPLVAFKAHLEGARGAEGTCEIYFYRGGYGGLSRVELGLSNLCFVAAARDVRARAGDAGRVMREVVMTNRRAAETLRGARVSSEWLAVALERFGRFEPVPAAGLLTVGDAASFIDPFTGSGMLMALEGGELVARVIADALPSLRARDSFDRLAGEYRALYRARFAARLRLCSWLRRAAFAPPSVIEVGIAAFNVSTRARRRLAQATRRA